MSSFRMPRVVAGLIMASCLLGSLPGAHAEKDGKLQILLLGDSTTIGSVCRTLEPKSPQLEDVICSLLAAQKDLPAVNVINQGRDGEFIHGLLTLGRYERDIARLKGIDYIIVRYGLNDLNKREDFDTNFPQDFRALVARLRQDFPRAAIIPTTIIPYMTPEKDARINALIRQAAEAEKLPMFDLYTRYQQELTHGQNMLNYRRYPLDQIPEAQRAWLEPYVRGNVVVVMDNRLDAHFGNLPNWYADRHPSQAGYHVIGDETAKYLAPLLREKGKTARPRLAPAEAVELVTLSAETWDAYAPQGKEVDCIYGDLVLRNAQLVAVIAKPVAGRNANMTVRNAGGCVIDLSSASAQNDQLSAFYPGGKAMKWRALALEADGRPTELPSKRLEARAIVVRCLAETAAGEPVAEVRYKLTGGAKYLAVETLLTNVEPKPLAVGLIDEVRADSSFDKSPAGKSSLFRAYDKWWGQAYGIVRNGPGPNDRSLLIEAAGTTIRYPTGEEKTVALASGATQRWTRYLFPASDELGLRAIAADLDKTPQREFQVVVRDTAGQAVAAADVEVQQDKTTYARGRTNEKGELVFRLPAGDFQARIHEPAHGEKVLTLAAAAQQVTLDEPGYVVATIRNEQGGPTPAKVQFRGRDGTPDPDFFHQSGEHTVQNLYYTHNGRFRQALAPGHYDAIVSYGTEHDAVFAKIDVQRGKETKLEAVLTRSVQTPGWVSADFHSHSSPSGDNTASQLGRVLNLLCEQIEFAPCTEHNRLSTYEPHLTRLGVSKLMGTCTGIELTDSPGDVNHHNAFPLLRHEHLQDNGAPESDADVEVKVERLALWDNRSDKLVQQNHPDIGHVFFDRNGDGRPDGGFKKLFPYLDCIEVHPLESILKPPAPETAATTRRSNNRIFNWLQLLNQGLRIPGVVNTDAHYNFHGSGHLRVYVESSTDDPAAVKTLDIVHAVEHGHVIMTSGPFMEVTLESGSGAAARRRGPGDDMTVTDGKATLSVRVQCPNWFDIDRVQVLLNGQPSEALNFTREKTPERFRGGTVKFEQRIPINLPTDTHVIVIAAAERSTLGPVFGPSMGRNMPIAVSNPIYVDVEGNGFQPNHDTLGVPLPVASGKTPQK
jgi:lysophospholipase L1-like esterase